MLRRGTKAAAFYRGNGLPAQLYHGTQLIAGYHDYTQQAMGEWEWSYNDHLAVTATGKGKQQIYSGINLIAPPRKTGENKYYVDYATDFELVAGETYTFSVDVQSTAEPLMVSVGAGSAVAYLADIRNVYNQNSGRIVATFTVTEAHLSKGAYMHIRAPRYGVQTDFTATAERFQLELGSTAHDYEPYVGGKPSPNPDYPQPLVGSQGTLTSSDRTGARTSSAALPILRAIPGKEIRDTAEYVGGGQWRITRSVGVVSSYDGESVGGTWASTTGQLSTGAEVWFALAAPAEETLTLGELATYPGYTSLTVSGDYVPDITATAKVAD